MSLEKCLVYICRKWTNNEACIWTSIYPEISQHRCYSFVCFLWTTSCISYYRKWGNYFTYIYRIIRYSILVLSLYFQVYSWGNNKYGQLGNGNIIQSSFPTLIEALSDYNIVQIAAGQYHSLALDDKKRSDKSYPVYVYLRNSLIIC